MLLGGNVKLYISILCLVIWFNFKHCVLSGTVSTGNARHCMKYLFSVCLNLLRFSGESFFFFIFHKIVVHGAVNFVYLFVVF